MTLPKAAYPLLEDASDYVGSDKYKFDTTFQNYDDVQLSKIQDVVYSIARLRLLSDSIDTSLLDWTYPSRWRRISHEDAASAVAELDDVQVVIDDILSSEWENHSEHARFRNPYGGRKPTECMHLEGPLEQTAKAQGLERWIDPMTEQVSAFWVVPIPGHSDSVLPGPSPSLYNGVSWGYPSGPAPPSSTPRDAASTEPDNTVSA
jgi:hypothetical protein